jgi:hypothetical protein
MHVQLHVDVRRDRDAERRSEAEDALGLREPADSGDVEAPDVRSARLEHLLVRPPP